MGKKDTKKKLSPKTTEEEINWKMQAENYLVVSQKIQADFENFRKRADKEKQDWIAFSQIETAMKIAPVLDNFYRAFGYIPPEQKTSNWVIGIEQILKQLETILNEMGVEKIPTKNQKFDPALHEAISYEPSNLKKDIIIDEIEGGYKFQDKIIKPAKVRVSKGLAQSSKP